MRKMKEILKKVFSLVIVTALIVTGVPTVAVYADTTVEEQEVLSDVTIGENSNETITLDETIEKEEVLEEYQQYVEDGTYDERVAFMQELEVQKSNRLPKATANVSKEGATAEQSQTMPYGGLMPSTGEVKALVFLVDFPDCRQMDGTTAEEREEQLFFGYGQTFAGFYNNSSYGKLKLDGDVYGYYTTQNNREYYNNPNAESIGRQELINELLEYYDDEIDYSDYDADKDGYIDALYIEYVGDDSGWGSFWWSYMTAWDGFVEQAEADGVLVHQYVWMNANSSDEDTYKHETGHLLGLKDYYDSATGALDGALGTFDMMFINQGDHNALSKILLGWIEPIEVSDVTQLELRSSQLYPDAAIVYPNNDTTSDEYFVVEYITSDAANYQLSSILDDGGIRVWRVNAKLTEDGTDYVYNNDWNTKKFIEAVGICNYSTFNHPYGDLRITDINETNGLDFGMKANVFFEGDELTPYSAPSSYIYGESESFYGPFVTSGIVMNEILISDGKASVQISYDEECRRDFEYSFEYYFESMLYAELTFDYDTTLLDASKIVVSNNGKEVPIDVEIRYLPGYGFKTLYISSKEHNLNERGQFKLKIEEGALVNEFGVYNSDIVEEVEAINIESTLISEYERSDVHKSYNYTGIMSINNEAYFFYKYGEDLSLIHIYKNAENILESEDILIWNNDNYSFMKAQQYGEQLLLCVMDESYMCSLYEVGLDGKYTLLLKEKVSDFPEIYLLGDNIIVKKDDLEVKLVMPKINEVRDIEDNYKREIRGAWDIGYAQYFVALKNEIALVDSEFNVIKKIQKDNIGNLERVENVFIKDSYIVMMMCEYEGANTDLSLVYYDAELNFIKREKVLNDTFGQFSDVENEVLHFEDGCVVGMNCNSDMMRFSQTMEGTISCIGVRGAKSVSKLMFFDEDMNYINSKLFWGRTTNSIRPSKVGDTWVYFNDGLNLEIYALETGSLMATEKQITNLTLNRENLMLPVDVSYQIHEKYEPYNANAEFVWKSSDANVAVVDANGVITAVGEGNATITVILNDGNELSASCEVVVQKESSSDLPIDVSMLDILEIADQTYTGSVITPGVTVKDGNKTLVKDTDYTVSYSNNINAGTATVTITGIGNYSGTKDVTFEITEKTLTNATVSAIANQTYTGNVITPGVTVTDGNKTLVKDTDYTVSYSNNVNTGTATVTITGKGNYSGTKEVTFTIVSKSLANATVSSIVNQTYTGSAITPSITVTDGNKTLVKDTDYTVSYSNNVNAGTATVTITGIGNYSGTKEVTFTIVSKSLANATVSSITNQTYTGSAITPSVTVKDGSKTLVKDTDYTVSYSNNVNAGTATVIITGKGNYTGTRTLNFTIVKKEEPKPQVPTQITSPSVSVNQSAGSISKITIGTSVQSFRASLNEKNYVKVYQNNQVVSDSVVLATGMEARVMDGNTVVKKYSIIVTGDTNGDGKMNITDMIAIKANILKKTLLNGVYEDAADVNGDGKINVTDFIKIKAALLKKDSIVGVAVK